MNQVPSAGIACGRDLGCVAGAVDGSEAEEEAFLMWGGYPHLRPPLLLTLSSRSFLKHCYVNVIADRSHFKVDRNILGFITGKS